MTSFNTCPIFKCPFQTQEGSWCYIAMFYKQLANKNAMSAKCILVSVATARQRGEKRLGFFCGFFSFPWCMNELGILCCDNRDCLMLKKLWSRPDHRNGERISDKFISIELQKTGIGHFLPSETAVCSLPHFPS